MSTFLYKVRSSVAAAIGIAVALLLPAAEKSVRSPAELWVPGALPPRTSVGSTSLPTHELTLGDLIDWALRENPATRRSWLIARQALAGEAQAVAAHLPQASVGVTFNKQYQGIDGELIVAGSHVKQAQVSNSDGIIITPSANLTWLLWDFGARKAGVAAARAALTAANYQHNRTLQDVVRQVQSAYFAFDAAQGELTAADAAVEFAGANRQAVELQRRSGLAALRDELQVRESAIAADLRREQARQAQAAMRSALLQLAGLPPGGHVRIAQQAPGSEPAPAIQAVESLVTQTLATRPDLAARFSQVASVEAQLRQAERSMWPTVSLTGSASRVIGGQDVRTSAGSSNPDAVDQSGVTRYQQTGNVTVAQGGLGINFNATGLFVHRQVIALKRAELDAARTELRAALNAARHEVWTSVDAIKSAQVQLARARDLLETSEQAYRAAEQGHRSGITNTLELLSAQEQLARARSSLVQARARLFSAAADLAYATGSAPSGS